MSAVRVSRKYPAHQCLIHVDNLLYSASARTAVTADSKEAIRMNSLLSERCAVKLFGSEL